MKTHNIKQGFNLAKKCRVYYVISVNKKKKKEYFIEFHICISYLICYK